MNPHRVLNKVGANYSTYRIRSFVGVLIRHLKEPNKYASWTLLGLWAPDIIVCIIKIYLVHIIQLYNLYLH